MTKEMILHEFNKYVARELSLEAFAEWLLSHLQQVMDSGDEAALQLIDKGEVLLVELSNGELSEVEFFEHMASIVDIERTIPASFSFNSDSFVISFSQSQHDSEEITSRADSSQNQPCPSFE